MLRIQVIAVFTLLALTACGTTTSLTVPVTVPTSTSFTLIDNRPPEQLTSRSPTGTDPTFYFGNDAIRPSVPDFLKATIERRASKRFVGKTVIVTEVIVSVKVPAVSVDPGKLAASTSPVPASVVAAPLAALAIYGIESARSKKWVYVRVAGTIDDKEFSAYRSDTFAGRVSEANVLATLQAVVEAASIDAERIADAD